MKSKHKSNTISIKIIFKKKVEEEEMAGLRGLDRLGRRLVVWVDLGLGHDGLGWFSSGVVWVSRVVRWISRGVGVVIGPHLGRDLGLGSRVWPVGGLEE